MPAATQLDTPSFSATPEPSRAPTLDGQMMKAIVYDRYGAFDELEIRDIAQPDLGADEIRVRVRAAGLHVGDCFGVRGAPFAMRMVSGLFKPKHGVPGFDFAGEVEAVGENVTGYQAGDEVFGECSGSCVEYVCAKPERLALKPENLSFVEAAAIPTSALAALHALRDVAKIAHGQKVLINGASGGVGTFAVQIAKSLGAHVTAVCSTTNVDMVRALGADEVIDYTREDFTQGEPRFDLIFDNVENRSLSDCRRTLRPEGTLILNSGTGAKGMRMLLRLFRPLLLSPFTRQNLRRYLSVPKHDDLVALGQLIDAGKLRPVIDRTYSLDETPTALEYIERGHAKGKVVVRL